MRLNSNLFSAYIKMYNFSIIINLLGNTQDKSKLTSSLVFDL